MSEITHFDILDEAIGHQVIVIIVTRETYTGRLEATSETEIQLSGVVGSDINSNIILQVDNMSIRKRLIRCVLFYEDFNPFPEARNVAPLTNGVNRPQENPQPARNDETGDSQGENDEAPLTEKDPEKENNAAASPGEGNPKENGDCDQNAAEAKNDAKEDEADKPSDEIEAAAEDADKPDDPQDVKAAEEEADEPNDQPNGDFEAAAEEDDEPNDQPSEEVEAAASN